MLKIILPLLLFVSINVNATWFEADDNNHFAVEQLAQANRYAQHALGKKSNSYAYQAQLHARYARDYAKRSSDAAYECYIINGEDYSYYAWVYSIDAYDNLYNVWKYMRQAYVSKNYTYIYTAGKHAELASGNLSRGMSLINYAWGLGYYC